MGSGVGGTALATGSTMKPQLRSLALSSLLAVALAAGALAADDDAVADDDVAVDAIAVDGGPTVEAGRRGIIRVTVTAPPGTRIMNLHVEFLRERGILPHEIPDAEFVPRTSSSPARQLRPGAGETGVVVEVPFTVDARTPAGSVILDGIVRYQACSVLSCEPPIEVHPPAVVTVAARR